jgi:fatty-acyl-CoA synthase
MACECEWPEDFRFLAVTPISHAANLMIPLTMLKGGTFIMIKGFSPAAFVEAARINRATATFMVPTMIYALLDHPGISSTQLTTMQTILYSAAAISPTRLAEAIEVLGPVFVQSYGQTEAPITISVLRKQDHAAGQAKLLHSCGMPTSMNRVRLLDDDCIEVPPGEIGEICVRGPLVMEAYWKLPDLTRETMAEGWLHTGDLARQDERGYLYIVDRKKDMIVSGGFNVFPREIEDLLSEITAISMAAVIGIPDERWGEAVCAVVVCKPDQSVSDEEIVNFVKERKGSVYAPKRIDFVDSIPLTPLGKPDKKALRGQYWEGHERRV